MEHIEYLENLSNDSPFISLSDFELFLKDKIRDSIAINNYKRIMKDKILPIYLFMEKKFILLEDVKDIYSLIFGCGKEDLLPELKRVKSRIISSLLSYDLNANTIYIVTDIKSRAETIYFSAIKNLAHYCQKIAQQPSDSIRKALYFSNKGTIFSISDEVIDFVKKQIARYDQVKKTKSSQFANTAYYMGSKKNLGPFLLEAISRFISQSGVVVDLMCGSGAASQAFSTCFKTYASDAQKFCLSLAKVQGKGFTEEKAKKLLQRIIPLAQRNSKELEKLLSNCLKEEDHFFHSNIDTELFNDYKSFIKEKQVYPANYSTENSKVKELIKERQEKRKLFPYCLFSAYYANIYIGLRQAIEIDSLRYAIDQLDDSDERNWLMGALVATLSYIGTGYAGQFAQPINPTLKKLPELFENRARSVIHEFSVRLTMLAVESEKAKNSIEVFPGPWEEIVAKVKEEFKGMGDILVYLDAPYKREEYSRYYHVLETLVLYNYPSVFNKSKMPDKKSGDRFSSVFFTRNVAKVENELATIIIRILENKWICAWSYSNNGVGNIVSIINIVFRKVRCKVVSYSTPYSHKAQGKRMQKEVIEYLIIFIPEDK